MQNLMPPVNTPDNLFHDGDESTGVEGTILYAEFMNNEQSAVQDIQQEAINVLAAAGLMPDPAKQNQLLLAIQKIISDDITDGVKGLTKTVNNKGPDDQGNIELSASDVGALASGGTAAAATKLATAHKIAGHAFDGTADISIGAGDVGALPSGGTAVAASKLAAAHKIAGHPFNGTADIAIVAGDVGAYTKAESDARYSAHAAAVTGVRLAGAKQVHSFTLAGGGAGFVMTGADFNEHNSPKDVIVEVKVIQVCINGAWVNIGG